MMSTPFKRVPAIDKCFGILDLLSKSSHPMGISDISRQLQLSKSTVFNIIHTLVELGVLENGSAGKFKLGIRLYMLGNSAGSRSGLIQVVHPFLAEINRKTKLSTFLGIRSGTKAVIIDKMDAANDIKVSSDVGMHLPLMAGAGGKALLSQVSDEVLDDLLANRQIRPFTRHTNVDKALYREEIVKTRQEGIAVDREEYIEGIVALAIPVKQRRQDLQAAIWAVGLRQQVDEDAIQTISTFLKGIGDAIAYRLSAMAGPHH